MLWISALQPSLQAPTLPGSASVTITALSRALVDCCGTAVGSGADVGAADAEAGVAVAGGICCGANVAVGSSASEGCWSAGWAAEPQATIKTVRRAINEIDHLAFTIFANDLL